jgi:hypothetical protein
MQYTYVCDNCGEMVLAAPVDHRDDQHCPRCGLPLTRLFDRPEIRIPTHMRSDNDHHRDEVLPSTPAELATAREECFQPAGKGSRWI